jgi:hypothetical protein
MPKARLELCFSGNHFLQAGDGGKLDHSLRRSPLRALALAVVLLAALPATAAERPAPQPQPTTTVVFGEGDVIDGKLDAPDVLPIQARPGAKHESLLRARESFREEVLASAAAL